MSGSISSVEGELNAIVKEFLEYSKLDKTLATFEEECQKLGKPVQDLAGKSRRDQRIQKIKSEFLQHFDDGKRTEFFAEWETHINPERRENDQFCQKLEFNLQIHFAVLPMRKIDHWSKEEVDEAMLHFHYYLESKGSVLSECAELLPYYALPYVPRPNTHPTFAELFQEECRQLVAVSSLLVTALENAVKGNFVDMDCVLSACTTHLPDLEKLRCESPNFGNSAQVSHLNTAKKLQSSEKLDFDKLKHAIKSSDEKTRALLFQALRWRLTKVSSWNKREEAVLEFVNNDFMDFNIQTEETVKIFMFIRSNNNLLLESFTRFLNAFASFVLGRQYLTSNPKLLELLVEHLLTNDPKDDIVLDMILGTLKKLSIRRTSQAYMVEGGVIEWLAGAFHSGAEMSEYAKNSAIALLFNLSLCPMGKKRCEPLKVELISGLGRLLQLQDTKISPYVNGILYRILSISSVREYAKEQALPNALRKLMSKTDGEPKKQLETILELFVTDVQIEDGSSDEEDDDQENDSLESEIDSNDNVKCENTESSGETLLQQYYEGQVEVHPEKTASPVHSNRNDDAISVLNHACEVKSAASELSVKQSSLLSSSLISEQPLTPKLDMEATQMVRKIVGMPSTTLVEAAVVPDPASVTIKGLNANEYTVAFSSRPKIPRTPEPGEIASPKMHCSSPLRSTLERQFSSAASKQGIYCNN
ncbi:LisH domain-containing protein ARMC9 [Argiope bruennichi]|uniref:LisH domain-containing protein ARMC9 n=1 Tax=Argiope bruennichi TaxID=94029 RepID=A0A8T0DZG2_ARGBR|nr:LisH domain-containing protein ARMC9 [Argiope bruennichi]